MRNVKFSRLGKVPLMEVAFLVVAVLAIGCVLRRSRVCHPRFPKPDPDHRCEVWADGKIIGVATEGVSAGTILECYRREKQWDDRRRWLKKFSWGHDWDEPNRRCWRCGMSKREFKDTDESTRLMCCGKHPFVDLLG